MTSSLLRQFDIDSIKFDPIAEKEEEKIQGLTILDLVDQMKVKKTKVGVLKEWNSMQVSQALLSENQDVIYNEIDKLYDFETVPWDFCRKISLSVWMKDMSKLKILVEKIAKSEYRLAGDEFAKSSRAERAALWYIALGKKNLLVTLYKSEPAHRKVHDLLLNDFSQ